MKAVSLTTWVDVTDGHEYREGDPFPFDGREIEDARLDELASADNMTGTPVISVTEDPKEEND